MDGFKIKKCHNANICMLIADFAYVCHGYWPDRWLICGLTTSWFHWSPRIRCMLLNPPLWCYKPLSVRTEIFGSNTSVNWSSNSIWPGWICYRRWTNEVWTMLVFLNILLSRLFNMKLLRWFLSCLTGILSCYTLNCLNWVVFFFVLLCWLSYFHMWSTYILINRAWAILLLLHCLFAQAPCCK